MGANYLSTPAVFLIQTLFGFYILAVLLRFLLQWVRADFYNPLSQFLVKITGPALRPLRRLIPGFGRLDWASLVLAWILKSIELMLILGVKGFGGIMPMTMLWALPELLSLTLNIVLFAIFIQAIASWISPYGGHPAQALMSSLTEPLLRPARRMLPDAGGIDVSPMLVIVGLILLEMLLLPPLKLLVGSPL